MLTGNPGTRAPGGPDRPDGSISRLGTYLPPAGSGKGGSSGIQLCCDCFTWWKPFAAAQLVRLTPVLRSPACRTMPHPSRIIPAHRTITTGQAACTRPQSRACWATQRPLERLPRPWFPSLLTLFLASLQASLLCCPPLQGGGSNGSTQNCPDSLNVLRSDSAVIRSKQ